MDQHVITLFHESIEAKMHAGENLAPLIAKASQVIVTALLNEKKILTCGNGISAAHAQIFTNCLMNGVDQERPSLPALCLGTDMVSLGDNINEAHAKQIRTLGQTGDILILISATGNANNLLQAISAAHDRGIQIIALTGRNGGDAATLLDAQDIELRVPVSAKPRIHEVHLLTLFCLCDLIDQQLFGKT
jgi:D-sedoheptulose 7-phosphate isomerase